MKTGDIVFFKECQAAPVRKAPEQRFTGRGFGILLGQLAPFQPVPPVGHFIRLLGGVGFVSFDDIKEMLGDESMQTIITKFEEKYWKPVMESKIKIEDQMALPIEDSSKSGPKLIQASKPPEETL